MSTNENVVFTYQPTTTPAIRYRAIPSTCTGSAATIGEARSLYRAEMTRRLRVDRRELPSVVEHVETVVHGMWVRERVGAVHRDVIADRMLLQTLLAPGSPQQEIRACLDATSAHGIEPVVVLVDADDAVGTVLDQMTPHDAVVITYPDADTGVGWAAIYGSQVRGADEIPPAPIDPEIRGMSIDAFAQTYALPDPRRAVRVNPYPLSEAS